MGIMLKGKQAADGKGQGKTRVKKPYAFSFSNFVFPAQENRSGTYRDQEGDQSPETRLGHLAVNGNITEEVTEEYLCEMGVPAYADSPVF